MSFETSKCTARRLAQGHLLKLVGNGIDIGAGSDPFRPLSGVCRPWDKKSGGGDATELKGLEAGSLDYVYASHCLEHLPDPIEALNRWADVIRSGGFMYVAVPDFDLYEGGAGIRNKFHKTAFSLHRSTDPSTPLYNVASLLLGTLSSRLRLWYIGLCDDNYNYDLPSSVDQTQRGAVCHIEFMVQKK